MDRREFVKILASAALVPSLALTGKKETVLPLPKKPIPEYELGTRLLKEDGLYVPTAFADQFAVNLNRICQQKESRLRGVIV